jgi:hypothetical protein
MSGSSTCVGSPILHACYQKRIAMSKYLLGWLLGVPAIVLVIIYLILN